MFRNEDTTPARIYFDHENKEYLVCVNPYVELDFQSFKLLQSIIAEQCDELNRRSKGSNEEINLERELVKQRRDALPKSKQAWLDRIEGTPIRGQDLRWKDTLIIADLYNNNAVNSFGTIFRLGFMKGQKARLGRKARKHVLENEVDYEH